MPSYVSFIAGNSTPGAVVPSSAPHGAQSLFHSWIRDDLRRARCQRDLRQSVPTVVDDGGEPRWGALVKLFGITTSGLVRISSMDRDVRQHGDVALHGPFGSDLPGVAFAIGWILCIAQVVSAIPTVNAVSTTTADGAVLLDFQSLGFRIPFLRAAIFTRELRGAWAECVGLAAFSKSVPALS
ncbi:cytochrome c biogenesis CcdA family protein [Aureimonas sp. SK2]|uniref:cytochrome c biogenesis CcdA family protein n=1 Tax=Aureimonas sp. SK2 TaxID=3015992 RepID=UPI00387EDA6F